jgi:hypothetical protein
MTIAQGQNASIFVPFTSVCNPGINAPQKISARASFPSDILRARWGHFGRAVLAAHLILNSLCFLLQRPVRIARGSDALKQVRSKKFLEIPESLILHRVNALVYNERALAPTIGANENAISNGEPGRKG